MKPRMKAVLAAAALLFALGPQAASAKNARDAMLILDASGSMWGQIGADTKIVVAKRAVGDILGKWPDGAGFGLMAYGHRSKGDCADIEVLAPVGALDKGAVETLVQSLQPRGKTPLSASLMQAAGLMKDNEDGATVILVSDGIESCNADPCAVAAQLKKEDVDLVAHVIGFDVTDPAAKEQLACIASSTGGVYLDAKDASGLTSALDKAVEASQGEKVKTEAPTKPKKDPLAGFTLLTTTRLSEDSDPLPDSEGVNWAFYQVGSDADGKGDLVSDLPDGAVSYNTANVRRKMPAGDFVAVVEYGKARKVVPFTITEGQQMKLDVSLEAGFVTSTGTVAGTNAKAEGVVWEFHKPGVVEGDLGEWVATEYVAVPRVVMPAGDYVATLIKENARQNKAFSLAAGDSIDLNMVLDVGTLSATALYAPGGPEIAKDPAIEIRNKPGIEGGEGKWIATKYGAKTNFELPSGKYDVKLSVGTAMSVTEVEIKSGERTEITLVLDGGILGWKAAGAANIEFVEAKLNIEGQRKYLTTVYGEEGNLAFNAGDYVAVIDFGDGVKKEAPFTIKAGERAEINVKQ
jgi:Ca-activated chloride channel homolog